ncbi:tetratricopeptide repeat protein [Rhizobium sp. SL86]|uniref:tetratricopeptide repeat protein n=1 Tax=Rhizobium sp. SL86 TaxID=2995148 RepID=UPI0022724ADF|nr:tetratricopeptide repeat protein [Rhizobium sp. SL86]MCY1669076.1 hypothetical protein [Rhizobium sp. SL86]
MLSADSKLEEAARHAREDRLDDALVLYQLVLDINPRNSKALTGAATVQARLGQLDAALDAANASVAAQPDDVEALKLLADLSAASGDQTRRMALLDQIVALDPDGPATALLRAEREALTGDLMQCERILVDALQQAPETVALILALSRLYFMLGMTEEGLSLSQKAVNLAPSDLTALGHLAGQLELLHDHRSALHWRQKMLLAKPSDLSIMAGLADTHAKCGELTEARRLIDRALALSPDALPVWHVAIQIAVLEGRAGQSLKRFAEITRRHKDQMSAVICLIQGYRACGELETAARLLASLRKSPKLTEDQRQIAEALDRELQLARGNVGQPDQQTAQIGVDALLLPDRIAIAAATPATEVIPLLRLCLSSKGEAGITLIGPQPLAELFALVPGLHFETLKTGEPSPMAPGLVQLAELSLANPERAAWNRPYIQAPRDAVQRWQSALAAFPRPWIALAWNEHRPGMLLADLAPLLSDQTGTLIGVAWDDSRHQLRAYPHIVDAGVHIRGLADLAALLTLCDAVIGPDGLPLHMAGALGRPGAVMIQPGAPWYWLHRDGRSVWYPSLRVMQARDTGHWALRRDDLRQEITDYCRALDVTLSKETPASPVPFAEEMA